MVRTVFGKDTLCRYISILSNYKYIINTRGLLSQLVYNDMYNRNVNYNEVIKEYKNTLIIYLRADPEDLQIRGKLTNEPNIDYKKHLEMFDKHAKEIRDNTSILLLDYNTSYMTPFQMAKIIVEFLEGVN